MCGVCLRLTSLSGACCRCLLLFVTVQVVPTRKVRGKKKAVAAVAAAAVEEDGGAGGGAEVEEEDDEEGGGGLNPEDLLPRADISGSITPALLGMIASANWKERNAGVDQVGMRSRARCCLARDSAVQTAALWQLGGSLLTSLLLPPPLLPLLLCCAGDPAAGGGQPAHPAHGGGAAPGAQGAAAGGAGLGGWGCGGKRRCSW